MESKKSMKAKKRHISPLADTAVPSEISSRKKDCSKVVIVPPECNGTAKPIDPCKISCTDSCTHVCEQTGKLPPPPPPPKPKKESS